MTLHYKTALILLVTMAIGVALGVIAGGMLMRARHSRSFEGPPRTRFTYEIERFLDLNDSRSDSAHIIIDGFSERFEELYLARHHEMRALMDSMHAELSSILTDKEMDRLRRRFDRIPRPRGTGGPAGTGRRGRFSGRAFHDSSG